MEIKMTGDGDGDEDGQEMDLGPKIDWIWRSRRRWTEDGDGVQSIF